jgi:hypothetical protein
LHVDRRKLMVEFFSTAISLSVWTERMCRAGGSLVITRVATASVRAPGTRLRVAPFVVHRPWHHARRRGALPVC